MRLLPVLPRPLYKSDPFSFVSSRHGFCRPGMSDVASAERLIWGFVFGVSGFILSGAFALSRDQRVIFPHEATFYPFSCWRKVVICI